MPTPKPNTAETKPHARSPLMRLQRESFRFEFFQAVRLLRWVAPDQRMDDALEMPHSAASDSANSGAGSRHSAGLGIDTPPRDERIRFRTLPSHGFPQGEVCRADRSQDGSRHTLTVAFMGLFGPQGVLPHHYTQLIIERVRQRDYALRDLLDLFNHRTISLFFRAWMKYQLPAAFEDRLLDNRPYEDGFSRAFYALVGLGTEGTRGRLDIADDTWVYYAGLFAHLPRNAVSLERMLSDHFQTQAKVHQFVGDWLYLEPAEQSSLGMANCRLGVDAVAGARVWGVENQFRVELGPLSYERFHDFSPAGRGLRRIAQLIRSFVGPEFEFEIQPVLRRDDVPACQLSPQAGPTAPRLGWNTWIAGDPFAEDADDAIFRHSGAPQTKIPT